MNSLIQKIVYFQSNQTYPLTGRKKTFFLLIQLLHGQLPINLKKKEIISMQSKRTKC